MTSSSPLPADLMRVLAWLKTHLGEPVELETLAAIAGVRPRTLETHFRRFLGTTPLGWVRRERLARAYRELSCGGARLGVTQVALAAGFTQLGRFAELYREAYGELPSQTAQRAKGAATMPTREIDQEALFLAWRAAACSFAVAPASCRAAIEDAHAAQVRAPGLGLAKGIIAWCEGQRAAHNFDGMPFDSQDRIVTLAHEAVRLDPADSLTLFMASSGLNLAHRVEEADRLIERATALSPGSPAVWGRRGWLSVYTGDNDGAIHAFGHVLRQAPLEPLRHTCLIGTGFAHFAAGRYERAIRWTREGVAVGPQSYWAHRVTAAAAMRYGARAEGRRLARGLLRRDPNLTVSVARAAWPFHADFVDRLCDGLEKAGVPRH
jgi:AraC-like DNA-binding protein